jgi:hypothetical protein
MKKLFYFVLVIFVIIMGSVLSAQARGHGHFSSRGSVWIGTGWGPWWNAPVYQYYWEPTFDIEEQSPVYSVPAPQSEEQYYWYYCPDSRNYYPYVKKCPEGWLKVVPSPAPPDLKE